VQEQVDREFGDICVTYLSFNDFKEQLAKSHKQPLLVNPMVMANQALTTGISVILLKKASNLLHKTGKSTYASSKLLPSPTGSGSKHTQAIQYRFFQYSPEFWLSHTSGFFPEQGRSWNLFSSLVTVDNGAVSLPSMFAFLNDWDTDANANNALWAYIFFQQHAGLYRLLKKRREDDLILALAEILRYKCFGFLQHILHGPIQLHRTERLEALGSLSELDLISVLELSAILWMEDLTVSERSSIFRMVMWADSPQADRVRAFIIQLGIHPSLIQI
jgi:hypothetical protein